jgi:hypothetical protein
MTEEQKKLEFTDASHGYYVAKDVGIFTFEVEGLEDREERRTEEYRSLYYRYLNEYQYMTIEGYSVPMWGEGHNLYPQEVRSLISENKLLPSVMEKRVDFLFGKGPYLYQVVNKEDGTARKPIADKDIENWLKAWGRYGYEDYDEYLYNLITDYYHVKTCISQYHFNRNRRLGNEKSIIALSYIGADEARLAANRQFINRRIKQSDCNYVLVGDWLLGNSNEFQVFPRFSTSEPLKSAEAIAFNSEKTFGAWIYAYNSWFKGLQEWIKASNLTPKYLNSYLKNALNAHIHVRIPELWVATQRTTIQNICHQNITEVAAEKRIAEFQGVKLLDKVGKPFAFSELMIIDRINFELERITKSMSGEGKNQGKLYASTKIGQEGWEFEDFPGNFKDYFESVINYDKRADQVVLAGVGISSSITNVENDGVISKSGSDVYYNYIIYEHALTKAESFVCKEINRAIAMNFPHAAEQGIRLGFNIEIPSKQQDVSANNRLPQQQPI